MILSEQHLENTRVVITNTEDLIHNCYLRNCEIILRHPTSIVMTVIRNSKNKDIFNTPKEEGCAFILGCFFDDCKIPDAHYDGCYFDPPILRTCKETITEEVEE